MNKLNKGIEAIPFVLTDYLGNRIALTDYQGHRVLISFFRGASCPFCNLRVYELIKRHLEFEAKGIKIVAFFAAPAREIARYAGKQKPPFAIIPDPALEFYKKYGVEATQWGMIKAMAQPGKMWKVMTSGFFNMNAVMDKPLVPADFMVDEQGKIVRAYYGNDFGDHIPVAEILQWTGL